jgi:hypothetical protein
MLAHRLFTPSKNNIQITCNTCRLVRMFYLMICRLVRMKTDLSVGHLDAIPIFLNLYLKQFTTRTYNTNFRMVTSQ